MKTRHDLGTFFDDIVGCVISANLPDRERRSTDVETVAVRQKNIPFFHTTAITVARLFLRESG